MWDANEESLKKTADHHAHLGHIWHTRKIIVHIGILLIAFTEYLHFISVHFITLGIVVLTTLSIISAGLNLKHHWTSRTLRIRMLVVNSFGQTCDQLDDEMIESFSSAAPEKPDRESVPYYSSTAEPGPQRFRENLAETIYFSRGLYSSTKKFYQWFLTIPTGILGVLLLCMPYLTSDEIVGVNRIIALGLVFFNELHFIVEWIALSRAVVVCGKLLDKLKSVNRLGLPQLIEISSMYVALSATLPYPTQAVYLRKRYSMNLKWRDVSRHYS